MDKLNMLINCKVPLRVYLDLKETAAEQGIPLSLLMRNWLIEKLHESKFRMKDYLSSPEESQEE